MRTAADALRKEGVELELLETIGTVISHVVYALVEFTRTKTKVDFNSIKSPVQDAVNTVAALQLNATALPPTTNMTITSQKQQGNLTVTSTNVTKVPTAPDPQKLKQIETALD